MLVNGVCVCVVWGGQVCTWKRTPWLTCEQKAWQVDPGAPQNCPHSCLLVRFCLGQKCSEMPLATLRNQAGKTQWEEGSHQGLLWPGLGKPISLCGYFLSFPSQFIHLWVSAYLRENTDEALRDFITNQKRPCPPVLAAGKQGLSRVVPASQFFVTLYMPVSKCFWRCHRDDCTS